MSSKQHSSEKGKIENYKSPNFFKRFFSGYIHFGFFGVFGLNFICISFFEICVLHKNSKHFQCC